MIMKNRKIKLKIIKKFILNLKNIKPHLFLSNLMDLAQKQEKTITFLFTQKIRILLNFKQEEVKRIISKLIPIQYQGNRADLDI